MELNAEKAVRKMRGKGILQQAFGWIMTIFWGICCIVFITSLSQEPALLPSLVIAIILLAIGVLLIVFGRRKKKLVLAYRKYVTQIGIDPTRSMEALAAACGEHPAAVSKNILEMVKRGFFPGAYLDARTGLLNLPHVDVPDDAPCVTAAAQAAQAAHAAAARTPAEKPAPAVRMVACKSCGATNKLAAGTVGTCEYCGSPLSEA